VQIATSRGRARREGAGDSNLTGIKASRSSRETVVDEPLYTETSREAAKIAKEDVTIPWTSRLRALRV